MKAPETKKLPSGDEAQFRASDPQASVWVSANAGSGKTHALTNRVARLLLSGTPPERILCLTFTKAAAAEMSSRLYQRLGDWAMKDDAALDAEIEKLEGRTPDAARRDRARRLFARAIETPGGLKIQTIHAFCERLLGRFPLEAGVPPNFEILDERGAAELLEEVRDDVLRRARAQAGTPLGSALSHVVGRIDEPVFTKLMGEITSNRGIFLKLIEHHGGIAQTAGAVRAALGLGEDESAATIENAMLTIPEAAMRKAASILATGTPTDVKQAAILREFLAASTLRPESRKGPLEKYLQVFFTMQGEARARLITAKPAQAHPETEAALLAEQDRLQALMARLRAARVAEATGAILHLAGEILIAFAEAKRRRALLDYEDLIARTRELLLTSTMAPWVLYKLDGGIDHILVDEAQDTSPEQWDVIGALAEEFLSGQGAREGVRTIFAVGDEKQSIFSFQGADPARFDEMHRHFERRVTAAEQLWAPVRLVRSFRSAPEILSAVDKVFAQDRARNGLTASGEVDEHIPARMLDAGLVEIWEPERPDEKAQADAWDVPLDYVSEADPRSRLAGRIARTIRGWLDEREPLASKGRPIRPGDILILVRRRDAFVNEMIRKLKELDIPAAGTDRMVLTEQMAVMDLMALGRFVLLPEDDLTLATVLRSPLAGMSEEDLFDLAWGRTGTLWAALEARRNERESFAAAHALLARLLARADFEPPYEFFAHILAEEGGRRQLLARLGHDAGDPIDEFLNLALEFERAHAPSLEAFLHWAERGASEIKRDMDQGRDEVRIMTVHGAKGLEAEIVFMPDTCAAPGGQHDPQFVALPSTPKLLLWPVRRKHEDAVSAAARGLHRQAQADEYRRLLYVAMTRARDRLYICGHHGARAPASDCWYALIAEALKPAATEVTLADGTKIWRIEGTQTRAPEPEAQNAEGTPEPLPGWARMAAPVEPTPSRPLAPSRLPPEEPAEPPALSPLAAGGKARFQRGLIIHRLLQSLPDLPGHARAEAARRFLAGPSHALDTATQAEILTSVFALLDDPALAEIFAEGSRAEAPVAGLIELAGKPTLVSGQIDRLCITPRHVLAVDYKTNRPAPGNIEGVSPAYLAQMAAYRAVLTRIYPGRPVRCALLWTDGPRLMELPAVLLDKALASQPGNLDLGKPGS
jgi:ATP-dependent helicase/nuclease subunit A